MAYDRIGKISANLVAVPPFKIHEVTTDYILKQEVVSKNIHNVPLNLPLVDSILYEGITNPLLCMTNWYPLAGSQRIRAVQHIKEKHNKNYNLIVTVHRFVDDYHNVFYLWGDAELRSKMIAIWFQLQELVFKSLYYEHEADKGGTKMTEFEKLGEELEWQHDRSHSTIHSDNIDSTGSLDFDKE